MKDGLDNLLQGWASRRAADDARIAGLQERIKTSVRRQDRLSVAPPRIAWRWGVLPRLAYAGFGAAVAALVIAVVAGRPSTPPSVQAAGLAGISESQTRVFGSLFGEADRLFGDHLRWIAQSDRDVNLGVDAASSDVSSQGGPLVVRVTVVARSVGEDTWREVWDAHVMARAEDRIELAPDPDTGNRLTLWIYPLADGHVAMDSRLHMDSPIHVRSESSEVLQEGKPFRVLALTEGETEYRVYQTVVALPEGHS